MNHPYIQYDNYGNLVNELTQPLNDYIYQILTDYFNNKETESTLLLEEEVNKLKNLVKKNTYQPKQRSSYYATLNNTEGIYQFKKNKDSFNEAHESVLRIRDILAGVYNNKEKNSVALYKNFNGKIKRITEKNLDLLNANRSPVNARLGLMAKQLDDLSKFSAIEEKFSEHYLNFKAIIDNSTIRDRWGKYNQGHIAEAFEGHFQHDDKGIMQMHYTHLLNSIPNKEDKKDAYIHFYYSFHNKDVWYKGGDIKNIQVKYLGDKAMSISAASRLSLKEIVTYIIRLLDKENKNQKINRENNISVLSNDLVKVFFTTKELKGDIEEVINSLIDEI